MTLGSAIEFLPPHIPVLPDLYALFLNASRKVYAARESIAAALDELDSAVAARETQSVVDELATLAPKFPVAVTNRPCHTANYELSGSILRGKNPVIDIYPSIEDDTR